MKKIIYSTLNDWLKFKLIIVFLTLYFFSSSQNKWIKSFPGIKTGSASFQSADGSIYFAGVNTNGAGGADIAVIKCDTLGNIIWVRNFGGTGDDQIESYGKIFCEINSNITILGRTNTFGAGNFDYLLITFDKNGSIIRQKVIGGSGTEQGLSIQANNANNGFVIGGRTTTGTFGADDHALIKTDTLFNINFAGHYGTATGETTGRALLLSNNNILVYGVTNNGPNPWDGNLIYCNSTGAVQWAKYIVGSGGNAIESYDNNILVCGGGNSLSLLKISQSGNVLFSKTYAGGSESSYIIKTSDGGYAICGWTNSFSFIVGKYDIFLTKLDANLNILWTNIYGFANGNEFPYSLIQKRDGGFLITATSNLAGNTWGTAVDEQIFISTDDLGNTTCNFAARTLTPTNYTPTQAISGTGGSSTFSSSTSNFTSTNINLNTNYPCGNCSGAYQPSILLNGQTANTNFCQGDLVTLSSSVNANTYLWNNTITTQTISSTSNGSYTLQSSDLNGCYSTNTVNLIFNPLPTLTATSSSSVVCSGTTNTLSVSGAQTYTWLPGNLSGASVTVSPTSNTTYTVTGTNANGCINTAVKTITVNALPTLTATIGSSAICIGSSNTLSVSGAQTYTWQPGNLSGASVTVSPTSNTTYTVTGTNTNGCTNTAVKTITVNALPTLTATTGSSAICIGSSNTLSVSGAQTYTWQPGNLSGASVTVSPTANTTYTVTGTNTNGCINTAIKTITVNALPTLTATTGSSAICIGSSNTLSVSGAQTYTWQPGNLSGASVTVSPTVNTTYTVTGTNTNGCINTAIKTITVNALPTLTASAISSAICIGNTNTLSVSGAQTYTWLPGNLSGTTVTVSPTNNTTYTVIGQDVNGCLNISTETIIVNALPISSITLAGNDSICNGTSTTLLGSGGVTYNWSNGANTASNTVNATGVYTVIVTDINGCNDTSEISITVAPPIQINFNVTNPLCFGQNGSITYTTSGGIAPLNTQWLGSINPANVSVGTYSNLTTDGLGCLLNATVAVTQPSQLQINATVNNVLCSGGQSGTATAIVNGGVLPYSYLWSNGNTTSIISAVTAGVYTVQILDANNCSTNTVATITQPAAISASVNVTAATCIGALDGIAQLNVNGGITPYSYAWSNGNTSAINTNLSAGNYSVIVSDANACTYTLSIVVDDGALPCFAVPTGFSPNGDGINDTWEIPGIDKYPNAVVTILNRWGQEIFNITNYATPWNGSYNGSVLPTADYYYIIKLDSNSKPLTGTVTIKR